MADETPVQRRPRWDNERLTLALGMENVHREVQFKIDSMIDQEAGLIVIRQGVVRDLVLALRAHDMQIKAEDVIVTECEDIVTLEAAEPLYLFNARWRPQTKDVELLGDQLDGMRMQVQRPGEPVMLIDGQVTMASEAAPGANVYAEWRLGGWDETLGIWLYTLAPKS